MSRPAQGGGPVLPRPAVPAGPSLAARKTRLSPIRAIARRLCGHGESELRELEKRTRNAEITYTRLRRLAGKAGRRAVAAERANDPATRAIAAATQAIAALAKRRGS